MVIITIARELGSGGLEVANQLADRLKIACVDREIISRAAAKAGVNERTIEDMDERCPSFIRQVLDLMGKYGDQGAYSEWGAPSTLYAPPIQRPPALDSETYRALVEEVIKGVAAQQSAVIVGRAGQIILGDHPDAVHVRVVADLEFRIKRFMAQEKLSKAAAEKQIRETDHRRAEYLRSFYRAEWRDPVLYDLVLNSGRLGIEGCVEIILHAVEQKLKLPVS